MSLDDRLARLRALIEQINTAASQVNAPAIDTEKVFNAMKALGAVTEESAAQLTWEDLQECGLPKLVAKQAATILRETPESEKDQTHPRHYSAKRVDRMRFEELFEHYRPEPGYEDAVTRKLRELSKGKPCVVFRNESERVVNIATSTRLLTELRRGLSPMDVVMIQGVGAARVFKIGEVPHDELDQNPLYPNRPLRTDETCDQTMRSWAGVPLEIRQLVFLAVTRTNEAKVMSVGDAHDIMDRVMTAGSDLGQMGTRFVKAKILLDELRERGEAPRLKMKANHPSAESNHPFARAHA